MFKRKQKNDLKIDSAWWYNYHTADANFAYIGMILNMIAMAFCLKTLASNVETFWSFVWWMFLLFMNGYGAYVGSCNINAIEERKLDLVMENL